MHLRIQARAACLLFAALTVPAVLAERASGQQQRFAAVDTIVQEAIAERQIPGAVIVIGHDGKIVYRKAFGRRKITRPGEPMTLDTVFDIASLTKTFTAVCVMQLVEQGKLRLDDPVAKYIPEFAANGKQDITVRQLLTHFSGLAPDLALKKPWQGKEEALRRAFDVRPTYAPGTRFVYSDINGIVLGALVERLSGMTLDKYFDLHVAQPLGLEHTRFLPPVSWKARIAPSDYAQRVLGEGRRVLHLRGTVNDPTARRMGGVAGHAGLFSTADDLAKYAQWWLDGDKVLARVTMQAMTTPQQPADANVLRGLGWDIDSPYSTNRGDLLPVGGFGHTGWTGTSLWIDPATRTYIIVLSNATHPRGRPPRGIRSLRSEIASAAAAALELQVSAKVKTGIDALKETDFAVLRGSRATTRVGLLTNQTGVDAMGRRTIDLLAGAKGLKLAAIFSPEHGPQGELDTTQIANSTDAATGVAIYSVYGAKEEQRRPSMDVLRSLDALLVDLQDAGARFYTYEHTLGYFLEAAAQAALPIYVLDRPNPVTGSVVQGPMSDGSGRPFGNYHALPVRHGMTLGELAWLFNGERNLGARLTLVPMQGWQRADWYDATGLRWVNPSPNLRSVTEAALYPGVALVEGTNVSVGRGTDTPFELVGAPWISGPRLAEYLNARQIPGVRFVAAEFTPRESKYAGKLCQGVNLMVTDRNTLDPPELGIELASALLKLYPNEYRIEKMIDILANQATLDAVVAGADPRRIAQGWRDDLQLFQQIRQKYLLYH